MSHLPATRIDVTVELRELLGLVLNEGEDDPYLWTFFLKLDGDTVQQIGNGFVSSITVHTGPGSHGNLGVEDIEMNGSAAARVAIPPAVGTFSTTLRPIRIEMFGQMRWVPGQLMAVSVLFEEDLNPASKVMEQSHQELRAFVEETANDFVQNLQITTLMSDAATSGQPIEAVLADRFNGLVDTMRDGAKQIVTLNYLAWMTPGFFWELVDPDDFVGLEVLRRNDRDLVMQSPGHDPFFATIERSGDDFEGRYVITGELRFSPRSLQPHVERIGRLLDSSPVDRGEYTYTAEDANHCVQAGQVAEWLLLEQRMEEQFVFPHPFLQLVFTVGGQELPRGPSGSVTFKTECKFPFFNPKLLTKPDRTTTIRDVVVSFERFDHNGVPGLRLRNRPEDGEFIAPLTVHAHLGSLDIPSNPRVLVFQDEVFFTGQRVSCQQYYEIFACMAKFRKTIDQYLPSKKPGPFDKREIWSAAERQLAFEEHLATVRASAHRYGADLAKLAALEEALRRRYRV